MTDSANDFMEKVELPYTDTDKERTYEVGSRAQYRDVAGNIINVTVMDNDSTDAFLDYTLRVDWIVRGSELGSREINFEGQKFTRKRSATLDDKFALWKLIDLPSVFRH